MIKQVTQSIAQTEAQFPGLMKAIGCKDSSNSKFLVVTFDKMRLFAENSPALVATILYVPKLTGLIHYTNSVVKVPLPVKSNQEFTINEFGTVCSLGCTMVLWFQNLKDIYMVPEGERPVPTPQVPYKLNITGDVSADDVKVNGAEGLTDSSTPEGYKYYTEESLGLNFGELLKALTNVSFMNHVYTPYHNYDVAPEDLEVGDYKFTAEDYIYYEEEQPRMTYTKIHIAHVYEAGKCLSLDLTTNLLWNRLWLHAEILPL